VVLAAVTLLSPLVVGGQEPGVPMPSKRAIALAMKYLGAIDKRSSFPSIEGGGHDVIFTGQSLHPSHGWRTVVVSDQGKPRLVWDSFALHDPYLDVVGLNSINTEAEGHNGYIVTWRGCAPHQCSDGRIGFALYASQGHEVYRAHVSTSYDNSYRFTSYRVTYYPKSGIPDEYRERLDEMICSDNGISRPSELPIKCSAQ